MEHFWNSTYWLCCPLSLLPFLLLIRFTSPMLAITWCSVVSVLRLWEYQHERNNGAHGFHWKCSQDTSKIVREEPQWAQPWGAQGAREVGKVFTGVGLGLRTTVLCVGRLSKNCFDLVHLISVLLHLVNWLELCYWNW